jgi:peptidoglycan/LPS O-acetylase OafA/YrhL
MGGMRRGFSNYCDLLRVSAAFAVLISHASIHSISGGFLYQLQSLGHPSVIVFFVLSGYVISYVVTTKESTLGDYGTSRFARLYSVVIPAIVLTYAADSIGVAHNPEAYAGVPENVPLLRAASAVLFLSQSWTADLSLFSDESYWSLPYEFWYYVLFGAAFFLSGTSRLITVGVAALLAGPKILLLLPIWLLGVLSHRSRKPISERTARLLFVLSGVSTVAICVGYLRFIRGVDADYLPPSFSGLDYLLGGAVALNLYAGSFMELHLLSQGRALKYLAGMTFSLYLFHLPLLRLCAAYFPDIWSVYVRGPLMIAIVLFAVAVLSRFTETQKGVLKRLLARR